LRRIASWLALSTVQIGGKRVGRGAQPTRYFALLDKRIDQSGKLLSLGGIRIDKLWPIHNPRVLGANQSFEVVKLGIENLERMAIPPCFSLLNLDF
jgi:hypothetical protein